MSWWPLYDLGRLVPGEPVHVRRADGTVATFVVEGLEETAKEALAVDRVFGPTDDPVLRLITCGGTFDRATGHYRSNIIVYARLQA